MNLHSLQNNSNLKKVIEKIRNLFYILGKSETLNTENGNFVTSIIYYHPSSNELTKKNYVLKACSIKLITSCLLIEIHLKLVNSLFQLK